MSSENAAAALDPLRRKMIRIAYGMLGSVADDDPVILRKAMLPKGEGGGGKKARQHAEAWSAVRAASRRGQLLEP